MSKALSWSATDQATLDALQKRKTEFETTHGAALRQFVLDYLEQDFVEQYVPVLRAHAGILRDLLKPFDAGERAPQTRE